MYNQDVKPNPEELLRNIGCTYHEKVSVPTQAATEPAAAVAIPVQTPLGEQYGQHTGEKIKSYPTR